MTTTLHTSEILPTSGAKSLEGRRPTQEDRFAITEFLTADGRQAMLAMVADGIGGQSGGERASHLVTETVTQAIADDPPASSEIPAALENALVHANDVIYTESLQAEARAGMGTTCTAVVIVGQRLFLAHVGDSRAYLLRGSNLMQLTIDHTWAEEELRLGNRTAAEIRIHPNRGVLKRFVGINPETEVDFRYRMGDADGREHTLDEQPLHLEPGDTILLSTDGLSDTLEPRQILNILLKYESEEAVNRLAQAAVDAGAADNVTAVVINVPGGTKTPVVVPTRRRTVQIALLLILVVLIVASVTYAAVTLTRTNSTATPQVVLVPTIDFTPDTVATRLPSLTLSNGADNGGLVVAPTAESAAALATSPAFVEPTKTLIPTNTVVPTATVTPTASPGKAATRTPRTATVQAKAAGNLEVALLSPPNSERITGESTFVWRANSALPAGQKYELIFWRPGEDAMRAGRSPHGASEDDSVKLNLSTIDDDLDWFSTGEWNWTIALWDDEQDRRIQTLSPPRRFTYSRPASEPDSAPTSTPATGID